MRRALASCGLAVVYAPFREYVVLSLGDPNVSVRRIEASCLVSDVLAVPLLEVYLFSWSGSSLSYVYCGVVVTRCCVLCSR